MVYISMNDKKAMVLFEECMNELYLASDPPVSWHDVKEKYSGKDRSDFYLMHRIKSSVYDSIVSRYNKLMTPYYRRQFAWYLLDFAPTSED